MIHAVFWPVSGGQLPNLLSPRLGFLFVLGTLLGITTSGSRKARKRLRQEPLCHYLFHAERQLNPDPATVYGIWVPGVTITVSKERTFGVLFDECFRDRKCPVTQVHDPKPNTAQLNMTTLFRNFFVG